MNALTDLEFKGRKAQIHYSLPKDGDQAKNQATLDIEYEGSDSITEVDLKESLSKFGEIRSIKCNLSAST